MATRAFQTVGNARNTFSEIRPKNSWTKKAWWYKHSTSLGVFFLICVANSSLFSNTVLWFVHLPSPYPYDVVPWDIELVNCGQDPTDRLIRKLSEKLLTLKRSGHLTEAVYNKIRPRHKPTVYRRSIRPTSPLRPIVYICYLPAGRSV